MTPKNKVYPGYKPCHGQDNIHNQRCCYLAVPQDNEDDSTAQRADGKGGFDAYFVPSVADHTYTGKAGESYPTQTGQTDVSGKWYETPHTPMSVAGYTVTQVQAADTEHIRVTQMVRDFGFLPSNRAIKYATSIGLDWDGFGVEQVGETDDIPAVSIEGLPMGVTRERRNLEDIAAWRSRRGMYQDAIPHATMSKFLTIPQYRRKKKARAPRPATS